MRLIDADALKEAFYQKMKELLKSTNTPQISNEALSLLCGSFLITEAPTITDKEVVAEFLKQGTFKIHIPEAEPFPEPVKRGKWIGYNSDDKNWQRTDGSPIFLSCSECNGTVMNNGSAHWNYCPNCGAKMDLNLENEDYHE